MHRPPRQCALPAPSSPSARTAPPLPLAGRQCGFTLLELIVALAIASLVALMGASALSGMLDFQHRSAQRSEAREEVRAAERIIRHEWQGRGPAIQSDGQMLEFDTAHPLSDIGAPVGVARVRLACETSEDGVLELSHALIPLDAPVRPGAAQPAWQGRQVLATGLQVCAFSLLAQVPEADGKTYPKWVTRWDDKTPAPQLMRLALSGLRPDMPPVVYAARSGGKR
ncbi:PulJ/GspJ family protein [Melaminivora jejuensis]|uniref:PulJ/GspJ family protein n=1 Tax=Melaminivora jejuensis TaxID=1267217 RepID=UPI001AE08ABA|nr:prepilin-type N-terminal cleavage/methylation domain-containing protein [Melaminivora jejuensis]UHJ64538.1 prepilin-type N-terminal cleavage/methylation domain-containing protein [Melaminivora jejuensis]